MDDDQLRNEVVALRLVRTMFPGFVHFTCGFEIIRESSLQIDYLHDMASADDEDWSTLLKYNVLEVIRLEVVPRLSEVRLSRLVLAQHTLSY